MRASIRSPYRPVAHPSPCDYLDFQLLSDWSVDDSAPEHLYESYFEVLAVLGTVVTVEGIEGRVELHRGLFHCHGMELRPGAIGVDRAVMDGRRIVHTIELVSQTCRRSGTRTSDPTPADSPTTPAEPKPVAPVP